MVKKFKKNHIKKNILCTIIIENIMWFGVVFELNDVFVIATPFPLVVLSLRISLWFLISRAVIVLLIRDSKHSGK